MKATTATSPADQCRELGIKVGDVIEGASPSAWPGDMTRIKLLWLGREMAVWIETRLVGGEWTLPRESAAWDLSWREWERIKA